MDLTHDKLHGGRVLLTQPREGYRAAIDPVLLAAAVPVAAGERVLDLGCGVGAISLCLLKRMPGISVQGVEWDAEIAALAKKNAHDNGFADRFAVEATDFTHLATDWEKDAFDHVVFNPPYMTADRAELSPITRKQLSDVEGVAEFRAWVIRAHRSLKPRCRMTFIHRADRLDDIIRGLDGFGEITVFPLWPKQRVDAKRVIVTARKGVRSPLRLAAGLYLHDGEGEFTKRAEAILHGAALDLN
jgi:tRNA1(Val) A37 N6-methylase TrmN6